MITNEDEIRVVKFGTGDILVRSIYPDKDENEIESNTGKIYFAPLDIPKEVGDDVPELHDKSEKELGALVRLEFSSVESLDIVLDALLRIRKCMAPSEIVLQYAMKLRAIIDSEDSEDGNKS